MGGGPTTVELVSASCEAGALGSLAGAYLSPSQIDDAVAEIRSKTQRPFAINLFAPLPSVEISNAKLAHAIESMRKIRGELGLPEPALKPPFHPNFDGQFESVLRARPKVFTFIFGRLEKSYLQECQRLGIYTIGTATRLDEALELRESGVDAVIAQGVEAGGHRAIFDPASEDPRIGALDLTRILSGSLKIPVITAGGLMTGADIGKALKAGAQAAMLGTAFLLCPEAGTTKPYRAALVRRAPTQLTRAFSGRLARGIENRFMREIGPKLSAILPFPAQNAFTRDIRARAAALNDPEYLSLWAGTGLSKMRSMPAGELVRSLFQELTENFTQKV